MLAEKNAEEMTAISEDELISDIRMHVGMEEADLMSAMFAAQRCDASALAAHESF